jgi:hypothetical protein
MTFKVHDGSVLNEMSGCLIETPAFMYEIDGGTVHKVGDFKMVEKAFKVYYDRLKLVDEEIADSLRLVNLSSLDAKRACVVLNYAMNCHCEKLVELMSLDREEFISRVDKLAEYYS